MIEEKNGRVYISGPVNLENALDLRRQMNEFLRRSQCVVDLSEVTEVDSAAVSLLLDWQRHARASGTSVHFANLGESISSLIDLYGVEELISPARV